MGFNSAFKVLTWLKFTFFNQRCVLRLFLNFEKRLGTDISNFYRFQLKCYFRFGTLSSLSCSIPISFSVKWLSWGLRLMQVACIQYVDGCRNWVGQSNPKQPTNLRSWHFPFAACSRISALVLRLMWVKRVGTRTTCFDSRKCTVWIQVECLTWLNLVSVSFKYLKALLLIGNCSID